MKNIPVEQIGIKDIYASNFMHTALWAFITAQRLCGNNLNTAVRSFITHFEIEDVEEITVRTAYYRKDAEFKRCKSGISSDAKNVFKPDEVDKTLGLVKKILTNGEL